MSTKRKSSILAVLSALAGVLIMAACSSGAEPSVPAQPTTAATTQPVAAAPEGGSCPQSTTADSMGLQGSFPQQFELDEFETKGRCVLSFNENPDIEPIPTHKSMTLPPVEERLPLEPLVFQPYESIGKYGGILNGLSNATEAGTSDLLSVRHVNLVRYSDDLQTIVPNIAKSWEWNNDFTELTFTLRRGHKWSDGEPFTAEDIEFWYEDLILNDNIYPETPARWLFAGEPMQVEVIDPTTVKMIFPAPTPGILNRFAVDYGQPFQPKHFLSQFHIDYNPNADQLAEEKGLESWGELVNLYYGGSDWKDVPSPLLSRKASDVVPTLESHVLTEETATGRKAIANPFFHVVDTAGNQLPYITAIHEEYVPDKEVRNLKLTNGEVDYKQQALFIEDFPLYKENEASGNYTVDLAPGLGTNVFYSFNTTHKDEALREIFDDLRFRQAMSLSIDREEINETVYLGQGRPKQSTPAEPLTVAFISDKQVSSFIEHDVEQAKSLLDEISLVDSTGDGIRDLPDGSPFVLRLQYSNQGSPIRLHELVRDNWAQVGVRADLKEVSSDEYRAAANNNDLDITVWANDNTSAPIIAQEATRFIPPFGGYFNPGTGFEWASWKRTDGAEGTEPPEDAVKLWELSDQFMRHELGSAESNRIGSEIVDIHVKNLWKIGIVGEVTAPIVHHNTLKNFPVLSAATYDYYRAYPFMAYQWYFDE